MKDLAARLVGLLQAGAGETPQIKAVFWLPDNRIFRNRVVYRRYSMHAKLTRCCLSGVVYEVRCSVVVVVVKLLKLMLK